ncbi:DUF6998 domain-containing protein [Sphingomonas aracearum]|uniref:DUF6998 domain-containing protein n=1 Tax=Sphingomonas aracearum TaxID=2283317 RepID=UPI0011C04BE9|nr:hypothetical protein [Sphingomonas aracearum]
MSYSPVGDYAETLFARAFGWTLEPNSRAAFDACDASGRRYQIKARRLGPKHKNCPHDLTNPPLPVYMPPWRSDWKIRASATLL